MLPSRNLKHEIGFIKKYFEFLADLTIKTEISQVLSAYKPGHDIHEHGKQ